MSNRNRFLMVTLLSALLIPAGLRAQRPSVLEGTISHAGQDHLRVNDVDVPIRADGGFRYEASLSEPLFIQLDLAPGYEFYLRPGDRLTLRFDRQDPAASWEVGGDGAYLNRFLIDATIRYDAQRAYLRGHSEELHAMGESEFLAKLNEFQELETAYLERFLEDHEQDVGRRFAEVRHVAILCHWIDAAATYVRWHPFLSSEKSYVPSAPIWGRLRALNLDDASLLDFGWYRDALLQYLEMSQDLILRNTSRNSKSYPGVREGLRILEKGFGNGHIRDFLLRHLLNGPLDQYDLVDSRKLFEQVAKALTDPRLASAFSRELRASIERSKQVRRTCDVRTFKKVGRSRLEALIFEPEAGKRAKHRPALAFFHGGGWECGRAEWGETLCRHFASLGLVAVSFQYRLRTQHGANPVDAISDAKSAIRWLRLHADEWGIDEHRIVAAGISAGGHLAASTAMIPGLNSSGERLTVSAAPDALMLWSPAVDVSADSWFRRILPAGLQVSEFNPAEFVRSGLPPSIIFQGERDGVVPFERTRDFAERMQSAGNRCDLESYAVEGHLSWSEANRRDVYDKMESFLRSLGYLPGSGPPEREARNQRTVGPTP